MAAQPRNEQGIDTEAAIKAVAVCCEKCQRELKVPVKYLGRRVQCKHCNGTFVVADANREQPIEMPKDLNPVLVMDEQPTVESFCTANGAEVVVMFPRQVPADEVQLALRDALRTLQHGSNRSSARVSVADAGPRFDSRLAFASARP